MTWSSSNLRRRADLATSGEHHPEAELWAEIDAPVKRSAAAEKEERDRLATDLAARHEQAVDEAFRRGQAEGRQAGEKRAHDELAAAVRAAEAALAGLMEAEKTHLAELKENLAAVAVAVARQIVDRELEIEPETVANVVRAAVAVFPLDQGVKIRINPQDLAHISAAETMGEAIPVTGNREARWIPDEGIVHGGCVVEGPQRVVDGRVDRALERVYWALKDA